MYDKLVIKVNSIDTKISSTSVLITKTKYDSDKQGLEKKTEDVDKRMSNTSGLVKKTQPSLKITEIKNKIPSVTGLVTTAASNRD